MRIFEGKNHAKEIEHLLERHVIDTQYNGGLLIIQVGDNPVSEKYINLKVTLASRLGIPVNKIKIPETSSDEAIKAQIISEFSKPDISGGIVQLPLPRPTLESILNEIPVEKDLDFLSDSQKQRYYSGEFSTLPPVVHAFDYFLKQVDPAGLLRAKKAIVLGYGVLVGQPIAFYLTNKGYDVQVIQDYKRGDKLDAGLVVLCAGIPNLVDPNDLAHECAVVDFGSSVVNDKTVGDLDVTNEDSLVHLGDVSLSPGGMGPLVVRFLISNLVKLPTQ